MAFIKSEDSIYDVIDEALTDVGQPQTCHQLMDNPKVRDAALKRFDSDVQIATNKLSDTLGFMWRRGVIDRFAAPPTRSQARWAYAKKNTFSDFDTPIPYVPQKDKLGKHTLAITEKDGEVILDFQQFTIVIRPKI
jgi:hypothetical protein